IIDKLGKDRLSGTLIVKDSASDKQFQFRLGMLTGAGNPKRPRRLGQILLSRGLVDRVALEEAFAYQSDFSPETPFGKVLVMRKRITPDQLRDAMKLQIEEDLWDVLSQQEGVWQFVPESRDDGEVPYLEIEAGP